MTYLPIKKILTNLAYFHQLHKVGKVHSFTGYLEHRDWKHQSLRPAEAKSL
jgi:hypothetical protein